MQKKKKSEINADEINMCMSLHITRKARCCLFSVSACKNGLTFISIVGHAGIRGNERADKLANSAVMKEGQTMGGADITYAIVKQWTSLTT